MFNSCPLTQIIYLSKAAVPLKFKKDLELAAQRAGVMDLRIFEKDGVLNAEYQSAFREYLKEQNLSNEGDNNNNNNNNNKNKEEGEGEGEEGEGEEEEEEGDEKEEWEGEEEEDEEWEDEELDDGRKRGRRMIMRRKGEPAGKQRNDDDGLPDECALWIKGLLKRDRRKKRGIIKGKTDDDPYSLTGYRKSGSRFKIDRTNSLPRRPKIGNFKTAGRFLSLRDKAVRGHQAMILRNDDSKKIDNELLDGGAAITRSKAKALQQQRDSSTGVSPSSSFTPKKLIRKDASINADPSSSQSQSRSQSHLLSDNHNKDRSSEPADKNNEQQQEQQQQQQQQQQQPFKILRNCLIVADDAFSILSDEHGQEETPNSKADSLLRTVKHLSSLNEYSSHHAGINLVVACQCPQISTGNSLISSYAKRIKMNFDVYVIFKMTSTSARSFITSLCSGTDYTELKEIYNYAVNLPHNSSLDETDQRSLNPYLCFTLANNNSNPALRFR